MNLELPNQPYTSHLLMHTICLRGKSLLVLTGSAGTGKSFVLGHIQTGLQSVCKPGTVFVTALTGIAAVNIGGSTLHSFAGIGFGQGPAAMLIRNARAGGSGKRWRDAECLIIDEVSMLSADLFDLLDQVGSKGSSLETQRHALICVSAIISFCSASS